MRWVLAAVKLRKLLLWLYLVFLAGFFYIPDAVDAYKLFTYLVLPVFIVPLIGFFRILRRSRLFWLISAYIAYMTLSSLWSDPFQVEMLMQALGASLCVLAFVVITAFFYQEPDSRMLRAWMVLWAAVCINAVISMYYWYVHLAQPLLHSRMVGTGILENPNPVGFVFGIFVLIGLDLLYRCHGRVCQAGVYAGTLVLVSALLLTQSRTAAIALLVSAMVFFSATTRNRGWDARAILLVTAGVLLVFLFKDLLIANFGRTMSVRPKIWMAILRGTDGSIWFGNGYLTPFMAEGFEWAHNGFLATLRDGGLVGVMLMLAMIIEAFSASIRRTGAQASFLVPSMLLFGNLCLLTDGDRLMLWPKAIWLFFWLPIGLALLQQLKQGHAAPP